MEIDELTRESVGVVVAWEVEGSGGGRWKGAISQFPVQMPLAAAASSNLIFMSCLRLGFLKFWAQQRVPIIR